MTTPQKFAATITPSLAALYQKSAFISANLQPMFRFDTSMHDNPNVNIRSAVLRRSFQKDFPSAVRGEGVYLWDAEGKRYLDLAGSAAVNFIGHGVAEISAAMADQAAKLEFIHTSQFTTPVAGEYAKELL